MFDLGVQHGAAKSYHENGTQNTDENWVDGELDGNQRSYYSNGQIGICSDYTVGMRNGDHLEYFENGRPKVETHLFQGKVVGTHRQFMNNEDSTLIFEAEYLDGILEGKIRMLNKRTLSITLESIVSDLKKTLKLFKYVPYGKIDTQLQVDLITGQG
jgi:antitoxin component YwqK of YwqJK toxin-antitoxin module